MDLIFQNSKMNLNFDIVGHIADWNWNPCMSSLSMISLVSSCLPECFLHMWVFKPTSKILHLITFHIAFTSAVVTYCFYSIPIVSICSYFIQMHLRIVWVPQILLNDWGEKLPRTWPNSESYDIVTWMVLKRHFRTEILQVQI